MGKMHADVRLDTSRICADLACPQSLKHLNVVGSRTEVHYGGVLRRS